MPCPYWKNLERVSLEGQARHGGPVNRHAFHSNILEPSQPRQAASQAEACATDRDRYRCARMLLKALVIFSEADFAPEQARETSVALGSAQEQAEAEFESAPQV